MLGTNNIWTNIGDCMMIAGNAIRNVTNALNGPNYNMVDPSSGFDMNMSRRDLPCYQNNAYYNAANYNGYYNMPQQVSNLYNPYYPPQAPSTYIPGISDPKYGVAPSTYDNHGAYYQQSQSYMNVNPNAGMYVPLQRYVSPFNNTGYPMGGYYGY